MNDSTTRGAFITLEGADGAGKSTQLDFIDARLRARGVDVVRTREPGGTALGEVLRSLLLHEREVAIDAQAELLMMFAARAQHIRELIAPSLAAGKWVLSDRFTDATYAYQGGGRGIALAEIERLEKWVQGALQPALTLWLDVSLDVGRSRLQRRLVMDERFDSEADAFQRAVNQAYRERAKAHPQRIVRIDADPDVEVVQEAIGRVLDEFIDARAG